METTSQDNGLDIFDEALNARGTTMKTACSDFGNARQAVNTTPVSQEKQMDEISLLNDKQVADRLDISPRTLRRLVARAEFPQPLKVGRSSKWATSDITEYIDGIKAKRNAGSGVRK